MAIKPSAAVAAATLTLLAFAAPAQAELQTWRLTAQSYDVRAGSTAPAFAEVGKSFAIDFVFDTQVPSREGWGGVFEGVIKSFTVNGITSEAVGDILADGAGLNVFGSWPSASRSDGLTGIGLSNLSDDFYPDVASALKGFATSVPTGSASLQLNFVDSAVSAQPISFVMTSVPEPSAAWLLLVGLPVLALKRRRRNATA